MRHKLLLVFFFLTIVTAQAQNQTRLSDKPADFLADVKAMLLTGKVEQAEQLSASLE